MGSTIDFTSQFIKQSGLIAILRGDFSVDDLLRIGDGLLAGTVTVIEVTLNSPSVLDALPRLRAHFGDEMRVGIGTVRDLTGARRALDAGAQFLISPNFDPATAAFAQEQDVLHLPGVFTPSEAQSAFAAGCQMLKLFPMEMAGPAYLRILRGPLDDVDFVPTGGITLENIGEYARAGAAAVGLGSSLVSQPWKSAADGLVGRAAALRHAWEQGKRI
jgi:2-dehydro-3-deoxyphosphogluconate aldolase/(4S)-4-hydroxy-2-oxoglutarate aldolase